MVVLLCYNLSIFKDFFKCLFHSSARLKHVFSMNTKV
jgi:hypothetical protein